MVNEQQILQAIQHLVWQKNMFMYSTLGLAGVLIAFFFFVLILGRGTILAFIKSRVKNKLMGILIGHNKEIKTIVAKKVDSEYAYFDIDGKEIRRKYTPDQIFMFEGVRALFIDDENLSAIDPLNQNHTPITDKDLHLLIESEKNTALTEMMGIIYKLFKKNAGEMEINWKWVIILIIIIAVVGVVAMKFLPAMAGSFNLPQH